MNPLILGLADNISKMLGKRRRYLSFFSLLKEENEKVNTPSQVPSPIFLFYIIKSYQHYNCMFTPQIFAHCKTISPLNLEK